MNTKTLKFIWYSVNFWLSIIAIAIDINDFYLGTTSWIDFAIIIQFPFALLCGIRIYEILETN